MSAKKGKRAWHIHENFLSAVFFCHEGKMFHMRGQNVMENFHEKKNLLINSTNQNRRISPSLKSMSVIEDSWNNKQFFFVSPRIMPQLQKHSFVT